MKYCIGAKICLKKNLIVNTIYGNHGIRYTKEMDKLKNEKFEIIYYKLEDDDVIYTVYNDDKGVSFDINEDMIGEYYEKKTHVKLFFHKNCQYLPDFETVLNKFIEKVEFVDIKPSEHYTAIIYKDWKKMPNEEY